MRGLLLVLLLEKTFRLLAIRTGWPNLPDDLVLYLAHLAGIAQMSRLVLCSANPSNSTCCTRHTTQHLPRSGTRCARNCDLMDPQHARLVSLDLLIRQGPPEYQKKIKRVQNSIQKSKEKNKSPNQTQQSNQSSKVQSKSNSPIQSKVQIKQQKSNHKSKLKLKSNQKTHDLALPMTMCYVRCRLNVFKRTGILILTRCVVG